MMKSILITDELHEKLKQLSLDTGIKIKSITETALVFHIKKINEASEWVNSIK